MAVKKRSTGRVLSLFTLSRARRLRVNVDVPMAIERHTGRPFTDVWLRAKLAVFDQPLKRRKGRK